VELGQALTAAAAPVAKVLVVPFLSALLSNILHKDLAESRCKL